MPTGTRFATISAHFATVAALALLLAGCAGRSASTTAGGETAKDPKAATHVDPDAPFAEQVVVAEFVAYQAPEKVDYFEGVPSQWKVVEVLKGKPLEGVIQVHWDFYDGAPCLPDPNYKFDPATMPAAASRWILFVDPPMEGEVWRTYRGPHGRWPADDAHLEKAKRIVTASRQASTE